VVGTQASVDGIQSSVSNRIGSFEQRLEILLAPRQACPLRVTAGPVAASAAHVLRPRRHEDVLG